MTPEDRKENLDQIMKAMELIEDRAFEVANGCDFPSEFFGEFRQAHENLMEMVFHLADQAGVELEGEEGNL
jgi:hypothetical protein